jgi:hypothetical protein
MHELTDTASGKVNPRKARNTRTSQGKDSDDVREDARMTAPPSASSFMDTDLEMPYLAAYPEFEQQPEVSTHKNFPTEPLSVDEPWSDEEDEDNGGRSKPCVGTRVCLPGDNASVRLI